MKVEPISKALGDGTNSSTEGPLNEEEFNELRAWMDTGFREYMYGRQILSTIPERTLRRYTSGLPRQPRRSKEEKELLHGMVAAVHTYQLDGVACAQSGADFASGLMASAACEVLAIVDLLEQKTKVKKTKTFSRLWGNALKSKKRVNPRFTFGRFLMELRAEDLFRLAREVGIYHEKDLPEQVVQVLDTRGYSGRLSEFVRKARNCIHPRWNLEANNRYARLLDVFYSAEEMKSFHADFALCAWTLHGRLAAVQGRKS
jgi:hypothetical protein